MAKPKLALIPAAQGSKLFSVLPSSGVGDFNFSRSGKATRINSQGLIEEVDDGVSRLNYPMIDGKVVGCPHHILEPARTNLVTYSEDFENYFNISEITLNPNYAISPDGTLNANKVTFPFASRSMYKNTLSLSGTHSISFWYKGEGSNIGKTFNVRLALGATEQNIKVTLESGWKRFEAQNNGLQVIEITNRNNTTIGTGSLLLYGFQIEQGSFSTSYIPTNGEANGVTRSAETANSSGDAATFNDSEGVLMAEISSDVKKGKTDDDIRSIYLSDGSDANRVVIRFMGSTLAENTVNFLIQSTGSSVQQQNITMPYNITNFNKYVIRWKNNEVTFFANGFEVGNQLTSFTTFTSGTLNDITFDRASGAEPFYGKTKQLQCYNSALTDSELEQLTSWTSFTDMANGQQYSII